MSVVFLLLKFSLICLSPGGIVAVIRLAPATINPVVMIIITIRTALRIRVMGLTSFKISCRR